jgi:hypothetical protein
MQMAAGADHHSVQPIGFLEEMIGGFVETGVGQEAISGRLDLAGPRIGDGCHLVGDAIDVQRPGHMGDATSIADNTDS